MGPYANNPSILIAKRNISSTNDVLGYLGELMKGNKNELQPQNTMDSGTTSTMRSFFKPDLLPDISYSDLKKLNTLQESLVTPASQDQFNWLTAEDILNAAEDSDYKITHSPII